MKENKGSNRAQTLLVSDKIENILAVQGSAILVIVNHEDIVIVLDDSRRLTDRRARSDMLEGSIGTV